MAKKTTKTESKIVRCAVYTRVSTDEQAQGEYSSLDAQKDICEHYISIHQMDNWHSSSYFEDPGYSGKNLERPAIQALLSAVESGKVDVVVAYKLDRISRSIVDFYELWAKLEKCGVDFVSATQQFDTSTPMGMLMLNMLLSFGQYERELISERTTAGMTERAKRGKWLGGRVPAGYEYEKDIQKLVPHKEESALVKEMYRLAVKLRNSTEVCNTLNEQGNRTKKSVWTRKDGTEKTVGERRFQPDKVKRLIANPLYKGIIRRGDDEYESEHVALVSKKLWEDANEALSKRRRKWVHRRDKHIHLLKGLLKCGYCGKSLTPNQGGKKDKDGNPYLYYTCTDVVKDGSHSDCPIRRVPARAFEDLIIEYVGEIGRHPEVIKQTVKSSNTTKTKSLRPMKSKLSQLEKQHLKLSQQVRNCIETAKKKGANHMTDDFMAEAERVSQRKYDVEMEIERLKVDMNYKEQVVTDEKVIADSLLAFDNVVKNLPLEEQKELISLIVKEINVSQFDPEKEKPPTDKGVFHTQIRTKWYKVRIALYANDLLPRVSNKTGESSHLTPIGTP
ncbi:recombinase family protein [Verrucomicrobiota bacterium]